VDPARVVAGLLVVGLAIVTLAAPRPVLRYVEGRAVDDRVARLGALVTLYVGLSLVVGL
jgi:multisubunit Na+/H+ antiporter MnhF subunit